jgi:hypothetical protein
MRHAKQFLYGFLFLIFWAAVGSGIYYHYKPQPNCFDNLQNQNEGGVDCGGVCARVCTPDKATVEVARVSMFPLTESRVSVLGEVRNPNDLWAAADVSYTFKIYDAAGTLITSFPGHSYLHAEEIKYIASPNVELPKGQSPAKADLVIDAVTWRKPADFQKPDLAVAVVRTESAPTLIVHGTLVNNGAVPVTADLTAIFYGESGEAGVSETSLEHLNPGETREFAIFHPIIPGADASRTRVFASGYLTQ